MNPDEIRTIADMTKSLSAKFTEPSDDARASVTIPDGFYTDRRHAQLARLSAHERDQQREAYIAAVDAMATTLGETINKLDDALVWMRYQERSMSILLGRIEALERAEAVRRASSVMARLKAVFRGR